MKKIQLLILSILAILVLLATLKFVSSDSTSEVADVSANHGPVKPRSKTVAHYSTMTPTGYQLIAENNLFRPLGWKKEVPKRPEPIRRIRRVEREPIAVIPPPPSTYTLVLTGIVQNGPVWTAIVEDQNANEGIFLSQGKKLKDTVVTAISPEHVILTHEETEIQLALGESIQYGTDGRVLVDAVANPRGKPAVERAISKPASPDDTGQLQSVIERMRANRQKELR